jgi:hypothetical protein
MNLDTTNIERSQYMILNSDQRRAHDIVERQLQEHLGRESLLWLWSKEIRFTGLGTGR